MKKVKRLLSIIVSVFFLNVVFNLSVNATEVDATKNDCIFGEDCIFCDLLDFNGECFCWLIFVFAVLIALILIFFVFLIARKIRINKEEEAEETEAYIRMYQEMAAKQKADKERQEALEAKLRGDEGSEDIIIALEKELSDEDKINLDEVELDLDTKAGKGATSLSVEFKNNPFFNNEDSENNN